MICLPLCIPLGNHGVSEIQQLIYILATSINLNHRDLSIMSYIGINQGSSSCTHYTVCTYFMFPVEKKCQSLESKDVNNA